MFASLNRRGAPVSRSDVSFIAGHIFVALLLLVMLCAAPAFGATAKPDTVRIGYQKGTLLTLVKARGVLDSAFKKQGVDVSWVEFVAGPQMLEALNLGSIDLATTGDAPPIFAQAAGADLKYISHTPANPKTEAILVLADSDIRSMADLKGRTVALNKGLDVNYLLAAALAAAGLKYQDIQPRYLAPGDARPAFQRGAVDAWAIWEPYYAEAETNANARLLTDATDIVPHYSFYLASSTFAEKYPDLIKTFNDQVAAVSQWTKDNPAQAAQVLAKATGLSADVWQRAIERTDYGLELMSDDVYAEQQKLADTFYEIGLIPRQVDIAAVK